MPLELQVRVLRLVQEHEIEKIGAASSQKVNVRIIAATHRDLMGRVADGLFREDLFYRLSVIPLELPPLRERKEDIPELVEEFFERAKRKHDKLQMYLPAHLMPYFAGYRWPGNVRELENLIERIVLLARTDELTLENLPEALRASRNVIEVPRIPAETQGMGLEAVERELIVQALRKFNWNQTHAARHLDISRKTLMYRIAKYGVEKEVSPNRPPPKEDTSASGR
jgi:two-component system NtrC family response regulator